MVTNNEIYEFLCSLAPLALQLGFDNSGFQLGRRLAPVNKALLALDITDEVIGEAKGLGASLLISHHPLIFDPLRSVTDTKLLRLIENGMSVISMHTNLDIAAGGVNDALASQFALSDVLPLDEDGCGRWGTLQEELSMQDFLFICKALLKTAGLRYYDSGRPVKHLAVMGGAGGDAVRTAFEKGCDTYLTADIKYHQFLLAKELGLNLIDGDHFCTENVIIPVLKDRLEMRFPETEFIVSACHSQTVSFI